MAITAISRDWGVDPSIVRIVTTDNLATITTAGYLDAQADEIAALQNGAFIWVSTDEVLISYSNGQGFFTRDSATNAFVATPSSPGTLSNTLLDGRIFVGSAANVATGVAMSGDVEIINTGVATIQPNVVDSGKLALNTVQYAKVSLSAANFLGMYAAPVVLVAAGGANTLHVVERIAFEVDYGGAQFAAGGAVAVQYDNTANGLGAPATATTAAAVFNAFVADGVVGAAGSLSSATAAATVNKGLFLSNQTSAFTTGTSTVDVHIWYSTVTTTF